eukprot:Protomagalhaensia_sp_Gyna_25__4839@NODE_4_length_9419_cov_51_362367_g3_i0_p1_GENE_NODE_4_length_9419_cov_51_362367_g3_i0NODE_4_length_9419_cov_51_362367_g3_i0_p1_ORF_typecomplete_len890_score195_76DUF812/PF05667_11/0_0007SMC_N/PF02463_19/0_15ATG16/PF08614_11/2_2e03ATG16/PF08614_11/3_8ATG16/PF08614_11/0_0033DUF3584/PF12128_8/0_09DUF3584/PF12128_8/0_1Leu_zip/PF15294_6/1_2e02Leu_zip/PF15294_6/0_016Leu_zip/PF15294_6/0_18CALCOCO1/PF07888_11/1_9e02CALCOCO1/PF07888_11/0_0068Myosin_tail_1/PF01576_19/69M
MNPDDELDRQLQSAEEAIHETIAEARGASAEQEGPDDPTQLRIEKAALEASLEDSTIKYTELAHQYENLDNEFRDAQLLFQNALLEKESHLTQLEADVTTLQLDQLKLLESAREAEALKESVNTLTQWHADLVSKLAICEQQLVVRNQEVNSTDESLNQLRERLADIQSLCEVLETSSATSDELLATFQALQEKLTDENLRLKQEVQELREALRDGIAALVLEKDQMAHQMNEAVEARLAIERRMKAIEPQLIPTWDRMSAQRKETGRVSAASHALAVGLMDMGKLNATKGTHSLLAAVSALTNDSRVPAILSPNLNKFVIDSFELRSLFLQMTALSQHFAIYHFKEWIEMASANVNSLKRDRNTVRWVHQLLKDISDLTFWFTELLNYLARIDIPGDQLFDLFMDDNMPLRAHVQACNASIDVISSALMYESASPALSTQALTSFSKSIAGFLVSQEYNEEIVREENFPIGLVHLFVPRFMAGILASVALAEVGGSLQALLVTLLDRVSADYDQLETEPFDIEIFNQSLVYKLRMRRALDSPGGDDDSGQLNPLGWLIALCSSIEQTGELVDVTETWSTIELPHLRVSRIMESKLGEPFFIVLNSRYHAWTESLRATSQTRPETVMSVELCRWLVKQVEPVLGGPMTRGDTARRSASVDLPGIPEDTAVVTTELSMEESQRLKEKMAMMESQLERLRRQEREFQESAEREQRVIQEMSDLHKKKDIAEIRVKSLETKVEELNTRCHTQEEALEQLRGVRKAREMAPPSVASLELLKTKASFYKLQDIIQDMAMFHAEKDWALAMRLLSLSESKKKCPLAERGDYQRLLAAREKVFEASTRNVGLEALRGIVTGQRVSSQGLLTSHHVHREHLIRLKVALGTLTTPVHS